MSYKQPSTSISVQKSNNRRNNDFDAIKPLDTRSIYDANIHDDELRKIVFGEGGDTGDRYAIYKKNAKEGDGSIMDAAIKEQCTGIPTGNAMHTQRCSEALTRITKWIDTHDSTANDSSLNQTQMRCAIQIRDDLLKALGPQAILREAHLADSKGKPRK